MNTSLHMDSDHRQRLRPHILWRREGARPDPCACFTCPHRRPEHVTQASPGGLCPRVSLPLCFPLDQWAQLACASPLRSKRMSNAGWGVLQGAPSNGISNPCGQAEKLTPKCQLTSHQQGPGSGPP